MLWLSLWSCWQTVGLLASKFWKHMSIHSLNVSSCQSVCHVCVICTSESKIHIAKDKGFNCKMLVQIPRVENSTNRNLPWNNIHLEWTHEKKIEKTWMVCHLTTGQRGKAEMHFHPKSYSSETSYVCSAGICNRFQNIRKWHAPLTFPFSKGHEFKLISFYKDTDHFLTQNNHHQFQWDFQIDLMALQGIQGTSVPHGDHPNKTPTKPRFWAAQTFSRRKNAWAPGIPG